MRCVGVGVGVGGSVSVGVGGSVSVGVGGSVSVGVGVGVSVGVAHNGTTSQRTTHDARRTNGLKLKF